MPLHAPMQAKGLAFLTLTDNDASFFWELSQSRECPRQLYFTWLAAVQVMAGGACQPYLTPSPPSPCEQ